MGSVCKGICQFEKEKIIPRELRYNNGQKRCSFCEAYFLIEGNRCPCCKTKLRTKARKKIRI